MDIPTLFKFLDTGLMDFTPENITDECPICAVSYDDVSEYRLKNIVALPCHHNFHHSCIAEWLEDGPSDVATCPNCRLELCKRPEVTDENTIRSLIPSLSDNWAEERSKGIWAADQMMEDIEAKISILWVAKEVIDMLPDERQKSTEESPAAPPCMDVFKKTLAIVHEENAANFPELLHPGSVGGYVTARMILHAIRVMYQRRGWDNAVVWSVLRRFGNWEKTETTSVEKIYRQVGLKSLAKGVKREAKRVDKERKKEKDLQIEQLIGIFQAIM